MFIHFLPERRRVLFASVACVVLASCSGIPISSIPRLLQLSSQLLDINPAELRVAIQLDARITPPPAGVPVIEIKVEPAVAGAYDVIDKKLPMWLVNSAETYDSAQGSALLSRLGLQAAPEGRRWLVYSFTPESQAELERLQATIKRFRQDKQSGVGLGKGGGKAHLGIAQESIPARDLAFANTRWESWIQTRRADGFFELWSGTVGSLLRQAGKPKGEPETSR